MKISRSLILSVAILICFANTLLAQETGSEDTPLFKKNAPSPFSVAPETPGNERGSFKEKSRGIKRKKGEKGREKREDKRTERDEKAEKIKKDEEAKECPPSQKDCPPTEEEVRKEPPLSPFEAYVRGQTEFPNLWEIRQFGYDLFEASSLRDPLRKAMPIEQSSDAFLPADTIPISPDYLLGPGDELMITIWGKVNLEHSPVIDREGKIVFPDIGMVHLSGLTFAEAKNYLEKELSRYYRPSEVKMNVSMGRLRSIRVFVVGKTMRPGSHTLSSFSTLINALFASGGPTKLGTMRDIQVKRKEKTVVHFDLYDFLLKGDKTEDVRLMPEDVIFIPSVGALVGIVGHVKNPAIYELKEDMRLLDLIAMTGGLTAIAFEGRVQIQRVKDHSLITYFEGNLVDIERDANKNVRLEDGDIVRIFPVVEEKRAVVLAGAVGSPGEFGVNPGVTRVKDVLEQAGGLLYYAFEEGDLTRIRVTQKGPQTEYFRINFKKALEEDPAHNIPLERDDYILVRSVPEWQLYRKVTLQGEVQFPGEYTIKRGDTLLSLIERAGGFTKRAYLEGIVFTRESVRKLQTKRLSEAIDLLEQRLISSGAGSLETSISQEAALLQKGALEQRKELVAKMRAAEPIGRVSLKIETLEKTTDLVLEEGDTLTIPEIPSSIQVVGSVYNQGGYLYSPELSLSEYLKKSGGLSKVADRDEIYVLKVNGTAVSKREISGYFSSSRFMNMKLDPGDTIVVPEKIDQIAWLREIKDVSQILANIALTAGVFIKLF